MNVEGEIAYFLTPIRIFIALGCQETLEIPPSGRNDRAQAAVLF